MIRLIASAILSLLANATGLIVAALLLSGFSISGLSFVVAVAIFTVVAIVADPLITKIAITKVTALRGGVALVTTLVGLIFTVIFTNGIAINGLSTWVLATLIVWLFAVIATLVLPLFLFKKALQKAKN